MALADPLGICLRSGKSGGTMPGAQLVRPICKIPSGVLIQISNGTLAAQPLTGQIVMSSLMRSQTLPEYLRLAALTSDISRIEKTRMVAVTYGEECLDPGTESRLQRVDSRPATSS